MRVLFAILVLAVAGLLWASLATAQYVRRARRRRRTASIHHPGPLVPVPPPPPPAPAREITSSASRVVRAKELQISL
jgi:hypothetical protein